MFSTIVVAALFGVAGLGLHWANVGGALTDQAAFNLNDASAALDVGPASPVRHDLSAHQTLSRVILLVRENYVDPDRIDSYAMFLGALDHIQKSVPEVMVNDSEAPRRVSVWVGENSQVFDLGDLDQLWEVTMALRDIFRFLQSQITDADERRNVEYAAINGMLSTLDPHSVLLRPESFDEVRLSTKGEFGGLGIVISIRDGGLTIISPIEGTPASRAGLRAKDKIIKIGEESTVNMSLEEAVKRLRGKPGTKVTIWVGRKGWSEPRRFILSRAIIKIESVEGTLLADGVGYVRVKNFQNNTYDDLDHHLASLRRQNRGELKGLILDLRNNPGGLLDQAISVSDRFVPKGPLVITVGEGDRRRDEKEAHSSGTEIAYPMAVLVNGGSASASEIVAGALKNHNRAVVLGQPTFGKGTVQVLYDFRDRSALKLTVAQYLTPGDVSIQSVGITPDVHVVPALLSKDAVHMFVHDDAPREKDLDKHLAQHGSPTSSPQSGEAVKLIHMVETAEQKPDAEEEGQARDDFRYDFEIRLAHDVLAMATETDRRAVLKQAGALFERRAQEEEQRLIERFKQLGVNWNRGQEAGPAHAALEMKVVNKERKPIRPGDTVTLQVTVRNLAETPLHRVWGFTDSENFLFNHLEFVFGKVGPAASRTWSTDVKLPRDMGSRADRVKFTISTAAGEVPELSTSSIVEIVELEKPRFAYNYRLDDRRRGNGDGLLQLAEKVDLMVEVTNLGPGPANDVLVTARNVSGRKLFLDKGREKVGALKVGETSTAKLSFSVRVPAEKVDLQLGLWELELGTSVGETLAFAVHGSNRARVDKRTIQAPADAEVPIHAGAAAETPVLAYLNPGALARSDAKLPGGWRRIDLGDKRVGFVQDKQVKLVQGSLRRTAKGAWRPAPGQAPPIISLEYDSLVTTAAELYLRGSVKDERALKDLFIFVNEKKVFYRNLDHIKRSGDFVTFPLDARVALKPGLNSVVVMARETEDLASRRAVGVYRREIEAIAERAPAPARSPDVR